MWSFWKKIRKQSGKKDSFLLSVLKDQKNEIDALERKRNALISDWSKQLNEAKDAL